MTGEKRKPDLEQRLISFAWAVIQTAESMPGTTAGTHIAGLLLRYATAPIVSYGEAKNAESRSGFIDGMRSALRELRATSAWLQIADRSRLSGDTQLLASAMDENEQLIPIFASSINTAIKNRTEGRSQAPPVQEGEKRGAYRSYERSHYRE